MKSNEIRSAFLQYFKQKNHQIVSSSSLIPNNDPTLLFTNAGMNQFKDIFLGHQACSYSRAVTSQKCVRAGGKHNDLENVGYTARHHTFFEMLGNFSFGDYFKKEAITYAWDFLTNILKLPKEKLLITTYYTDTQSYDIWLNDIGIPSDCIIRIGDKNEPYNSDNFWQMGDTGPCGPCTEIFYDHGESVEGERPGQPGEDGDRFIEIWNIVFMQYNRETDGSFSILPKPSVDTGMGLERLSAILQGKHNNYDIDLFQSLLTAASNLLNNTNLSSASLRVIVDHIRSSSFLITDGILPSNEGRGYTLRRIIRRACLHGNKLGVTTPFFYLLVQPLMQEMGETYPELIEQKQHIERTLKKEEEQFGTTLNKGLKLLKQNLQNLTDSVIPCDLVFTLYDTYGFPLDLTEDIAKEHNLTIDYQGFEKALQEQRHRARKASKFHTDYNTSLVIEGKSHFTGYDRLEHSATVTHLFINQQPASSVSHPNENEIMIVLNNTPFYAESGGQVGDIGVLSSKNCTIKVHNTIKQNNHHLHITTITNGSLSVGDEIHTNIDTESRQNTTRNHSATHLLHAALRQTFGSHVLQKGSLVDPNKLRFDFSHYQAISKEQLNAIEEIVNRQILDNTAVKTELMPINQAKEKGAIALFDDKYADNVRVLTIGSNNFSIELCGGTHVKRTGDIGCFQITSETGISSGVRRIEAVTGLGAQQHQKETNHTLQTISHLIKSAPNKLINNTQHLIDKQHQLEKEITQLQQKLASLTSLNIINEAINFQDIKIIATKIDGIDTKTLRDLIDKIKQKIGSGVIVLALLNSENKFPIVAGVTNDLLKKIQAGDILKVVAQQVGGKGGGRPDFAQGGGTQAQHLDKALESIVPWIKNQLTPS